MMKQGYYLSAYVCVDEFQNLMDIKLRHDQTIALWEYRGDVVKLVKYWELERISGLKQHAKAIYSKAKFNDLLKQLLCEVNVELGDIIEIWGVKTIENRVDYRTYLDSRFAFHSIAHLLTALFYDNTSPTDSCILSMALDSGLDSQFEEDAYSKFYYAGCVIKNSDISFFSVESPAKLWSYSFKKFGLREGTLMALSSAMNTKWFIPDAQMEKWLQGSFFDESCRLTAQQLVDDVFDFVDKLDESQIGICCTNFDDRFSAYENKLSMTMKIISDISMKIVSRSIDSAVKKYELDTRTTTFALAGGFALNCPTNIALIEKYEFCSYQIPPCASDTGIAMGIGLAAFSQLLLSKQASIRIDTAFLGQAVSSNIEKRCLLTVIILSASNKCQWSILSKPSLRVISWFG